MPKSTLEGGDIFYINAKISIYHKIKINITSKQDIKVLNCLPRMIRFFSLVIVIVKGIKLNKNQSFFMFTSSFQGI